MILDFFKPTYILEPWSFSRFFSFCLKKPIFNIIKSRLDDLYIVYFVTQWKNLLLYFFKIKEILFKLLELWDLCCSFWARLAHVASKQTDLTSYSLYLK